MQITFEFLKVQCGVCLLVTTMNCAKMNKPIEMSFGAGTRTDPRNHVLGGAWLPQGKEQI